MTASAFSFSEAATGGVLWKKVFLKILQEFTGKHLWFAKFWTSFLHNTFATATSLRWDTANSVWKNSDEYSLSRNTNLRTTAPVYHFFLSSINFQCMFSLVYTVYCQKQPQGVIKNFRKFHKKIPMLESLFNKVTGLTPILKNICQRLFLHCTHTHTPFTVTYPFYFIFSTFFFIITVTTQKQSSGGVL